MSPNSMAVELRDVSRRFTGPSPVDALSDIWLDVAEGDFAAIEGPSGSGKTTLMNILGLLDRPTNGTYRLGGSCTHRMTENERAATRATNIGFVFQQFHLLPHRSVAENVELAQLYLGVSPAERVQAARMALDAVGLGHRLDFYPTTLSGGEQQRVAIARALVGRPTILLADEPTGNLDSVTTNGILDLFEEINAQGQTVIVITHEADVARRASTRLLMDDGRLAPRRVQ